MKKMFIKVTVNEEDDVPTDGEYDTNLGMIEIFCGKWVADELPEWYLEEVEFPSEKEIDNIFPIQSGSETFLFNKDARKGAKWMLNYILGNN